MTEVVLDPAEPVSHVLRQQQAQPLRHLAEKPIESLLTFYGPRTFGSGFGVDSYVSGKSQLGRKRVADLGDSSAATSLPLWTKHADGSW
ncbi:MAG: hypothetical protein ABSH45_17145 [Bryobacteraceae bacterium]